MASLYEEFLCRSNYVAALVTVYMLVFVVYVIYAVVTHNKPKKEIKEVHHVHHVQFPWTVNPESGSKRL